MAENEKKPHADGQREQYGDGKHYREADLSKGADKANDLGGFAGGKRPAKSIPDPKEPEGKHNHRPGFSPGLLFSG